MQFSVLLALEEPDTLEFYRSNLEEAGFAVLTTHPGAALAAARQVRPDVIVVDGAHRSGAHACGEFKKDARLHRIPLIVLAPPGAHSAFDSACDAVLPVHCLDVVLIEAIDRLLADYTRPR